MKQNHKKAIEYYEMAINSIDYRAANALAVYFEEGKFVPKDYERALKLYYIAIERGDFEANINIIWFFIERLKNPE